MSTEEVKTPAAEIPADLNVKVQSLKAIVAIHELLQTRQSNLSEMNLIINSCEFLKALHTQLMIEVKNHPDSSLVKELADEKS